MAPAIFAAVAALLAFAGTTGASGVIYGLHDTIDSTNFRDKTEFVTVSSPLSANISGFAKFVDGTEAFKRKLAEIRKGPTGDVVFLRPDSTTNVTAPASGRNSYKVRTKEAYKDFAIIMRFARFPKPVCGARPAIYTAGQTLGPKKGAEFHMLGGWNENEFNMASLHLASKAEIGTCKLASGDQRGKLITADCDDSSPLQPKNFGCVTQETEKGLDVWGKETGGTIVLIQSSKELRIFTYPTGDEPRGLFEDRLKLDVIDWRTRPTLHLRDCDLDHGTAPQKLVFEMDFCGKAGNSLYWGDKTTGGPESCFAKTGGMSCAEYVAKSPKDFELAALGLIDIRILTPTLRNNTSSSSTITSYMNMTATSPSATPTSGPYHNHTTLGYNNHTTLGYHNHTTLGYNSSSKIMLSTGSSDTVAKSTPWTSPTSARYADHTTRGHKASATIVLSTGSSETVAESTPWTSPTSAQYTNNTTPGRKASSTSSHGPRSSGTTTSPGTRRGPSTVPTGPSTCRSSSTTSAAESGSKATSSPSSGGSAPTSPSEPGSKGSPGGAASHASSASKMDPAAAGDASSPTTPPQAGRTDASSESSHSAGGVDKSKPSATTSLGPGASTDLSTGASPGAASPAPPSLDIKEANLTVYRWERFQDPGQANAVLKLVIWFTLPKCRVSWWKIWLQYEVRDGPDKKPLTVFVYHTAQIIEKCPPEVKDCPLGKTVYRTFHVTFISKKPIILKSLMTPQANTPAANGPCSGPECDTPTPAAKIDGSSTVTPAENTGTSGTPTPSAHVDSSSNSGERDPAKPDKTKTKTTALKITIEAELMLKSVRYCQSSDPGCSESGFTCRVCIETGCRRLKPSDTPAPDGSHPGVASARPRVSDPVQQGPVPVKPSIGVDVKLGVEQKTQTPGKDKPQTPGKDKPQSPGKDKGSKTDPDQNHGENAKGGATTKPPQPERPGKESPSGSQSSPSQGSSKKPTAEEPKNEPKVDRPKGERPKGKEPEGGKSEPGKPPSAERPDGGQPKDGPPKAGKPKNEGPTAERPKAKEPEKSSPGDPSPDPAGSPSHSDAPPHGDTHTDRPASGAETPNHGTVPMEPSRPADSGPGSAPAGPGHVPRPPESLPAQLQSGVAAWGTGWTHWSALAGALVFLL